jgi:hypothetical protein
MQASTVHFPASLRLRVPQGLPEALQVAARQRHTTPSEWARQTLLRGLADEGVRLGDTPTQNALDRLDPRITHRREAAR